MRASAQRTSAIRVTMMLAGGHVSGRQANYQGKQMIKLEKTVSAVVAISALLVALSACQKQEGPAERAGKEMDKATGKAGQQMEKAGDRIQDAAKGNKKKSPHRAMA